MQKISNKTRDILYNTVSNEVTDARIKIDKLNISDKFIKDQIDKIMFELQCGAPQRAISCFDYNKER